jgi:hypothetical protein
MHIAIPDPLTLPLGQESREALAARRRDRHRYGVVAASRAFPPLARPRSI